MLWLTLYFYIVNHGLISCFHALSRNDSICQGRWRCADVHRWHGVDVKIGHNIPWQWTWRQVASRLMYCFAEERATRGYFTEMFIFIRYVYQTFHRTSSWRVFMVHFAQVTNMFGWPRTEHLSSFRKEIEHLRSVKEVNNLISLLLYGLCGPFILTKYSRLCYLEYCRTFNINIPTITKKKSKGKKE